MRPLWYMKEVQISVYRCDENLPLPLGEVPQNKDLGRRGFVIPPLSQKSKIFASSPIGRAKGATNSNLYNQKNHLTVKLAIKKPTKSANNAAGTAYRVFLMPTAPK